MLEVIGSLINDHGDGNENGRKATGLNLLNNTCTHHAVFAIVMHDYDLKLPNFTFYGGREHKKSLK